MPDARAYLGGSDWRFGVRTATRRASRRGADLCASTQRREAVRVVKIDTEKYPALASKYQARKKLSATACRKCALTRLRTQISALPTLVLFKGGKPVDRIEGLPTAAQLIARVRSYL